ncbi:MAG: glycosyltransferase family 9 protein [Flavobacteriales bacterium]|nr:glycosyltransferase family 9 protein [Flavobacteriales bacterium]MCX7769245.1 glycosyltransferase family 9 protein [Flavobacteriales bacterium]MDW8410954.1 glycosyltransferase family 9 protein [Flavobacteriales bacterium]
MKILVIRFSSIGDILLTTPVLRCVAQQIPQAELHFATKVSYALLVDRSPYVTRVHGLNADFPAFISGLKKEKFDLILDLHGSLRSLRVCYLLGSRVLRYRKQNLRKWIIVHLKRRWSVSHVVERYLEACSPLGVRYDGQGLDFPLLDQEIEFTGHLFPESFSAGFLAVTAGARHFTKALPPDKLAEILNEIGMPVALLGGVAEEKTGAQVLRLLSVPAVNLCGRLSLGMSAAVLWRARAVLAHDTGLMHMAAALRKPMVVVWGSTTPALGMYPLYPEGEQNKVAYAQIEELSCRPCSRMGRSRCPKGHFACMRHQSPALIRRLLMEKTTLSAP